MLQIFGEDVSDLIATIDHNLVSDESGQPPLFQRTLTYNNIPPEVMERWRRHAAERSQSLLEELDKWLGPHDRDISGQETESVSGEPVRTGVSIFFFEEPAGNGGRGGE